MYDADDHRIIATMNSLRQKLWLKTDVGGLARYEGDYYHQVDTSFPGNPWFICTLWLADHLTDKAHNEKELDESIKILEWVAEHALPSGVLAEQVHPVTGKPLSVSRTGPSCHGKASFGFSPDLESCYFCCHDPKNNAKNIQDS